jgi:hypothetical protein
MLPRKLTLQVKNRQLRLRKQTLRHSRVPPATRLRRLKKRKQLDWHQTGPGLGNLFLTSGTRNCHQAEDDRGARGWLASRLMENLFSVCLPAAE